jgi:non-specific serine/threonine protein kinase/serine/threonine-protein kinase
MVGMSDQPTDARGSNTAVGEGAAPADEMDRTKTGWTPVAERTQPDRIGPYRVLELLGRGGMGSVYLAEQTAPIRRRVAIKLTNPRSNTDVALRRFDAERQALALMNHPNIAQVYDAGTSEAGEPFFVMEHVAGNPLIDYCDDHRIDVRGRLELMLAVCDGVHHAHQKGVIHRDLKPSNILVTTNGEPVPKIIDFGIAKALDEPLTDATLMTGDRLLGTPAYMSPERIKVGGDIDVRADIYSLGVMLYELLTGELPFEMEDSGYYEIASRVLTEDPARPSDRVTTFDRARLSEVAQERSTDGTGLGRRLRGDLDWITMKAMEKDRGRRYDSAAALAADIRRHLKREPVEAGPPSKAYRMARFIQLHTVAVISAAVVVLALLAGIVGTTVQARRANREAERANQEAAAAEQVSDFLVGLFRVSDPSEALGETITAREILDRGAEKINADLADQPHIQARLQETMGEVYNGLGLFDASEELFIAAYETERELHDEPHLHLVEALSALGRLYHWKGNFPAAEGYLRQAREMSEALELGDSVTMAERISALGGVVGQQGRFEEAIALQLSAVEILRAIDEPGELAEVLLLLGILSTEHGDWQGADGYLVESIEIMEGIGSEDKPKYARAMVARANVLKRLGRFEEAEAGYRKAVAIQERIFDPEHPLIIESRMSLANLLLEQERFDEAGPLYEWTVAASERRFGPDHPTTGQLSFNLALFYNGQKDYERALPHCERAKEILEGNLGPDHYIVAMIDVVLGDIHAGEGRLDQAEASYLRALDRLEHAVGGEHPRYAEAALSYAAFLESTNREDEALDYRSRGEAIMERAKAGSG